jgi:arginase
VQDSGALDCGGTATALFATESGSCAAAVQSFATIARVIRYFTVPYDSGHRGVRMGAGPLRLAETLGVETEPIESDDKFPREIGTAFELYAKLATAVHGCVANKDFPVVFSGNCGAINGLAAGIGMGDLAVIWFDAHGEFMTPETTTSGFLDGMGLAILNGRCWKSMASKIPWWRPMPFARTMLVGSRDYSPGERDELMANAVPLVEPLNLTEPNVDRWLSAMSIAGAKRLLVHVDLDVLDPKYGRANEFAAEGGMSPDEILRVIAIAMRRFDVVALELASYDPGCDDDGRVAEAGAAIVRATAPQTPRY